MPKIPSNKLFRLIKSLSGSEKRYFKLFVHEDGRKSNKYIQLFDAIETQEEFDDGVLKKIIYKGEAIQSRKYSELKAYLYDLILKSLQAFDEKLEVDFRIKQLLNSVRVLYRRSLFADCLDLLKKTKKLAYRYEKFNAILEILDWEKQVAYTQTNIDFLDEELPRIEMEEKEILGRLSNLKTYRHLFLQLLVSLRKDSFLRSEEQRARQKLLKENILIKDISQASSHRAKIFYYRFLSAYHYSLLEFDQFYELGKQLLILMESQPHILEEEKSEYISALSNFALSCNMLGRYEELEKCLEKFQLIDPSTRDDHVKIHRQYYTLKFRLCINTGAFEEGLKALNSHLKEVKKFDTTIFEKGDLYFQYFYIYFGNKDYDKALECLNKWLNLPKTVERKDLYSLARILNLIVHYEMGNSILLNSLIRSTQRFLSKENKLFELERHIVGHIRDANKVIGQVEEKQVFLNLKQALKPLTKIPSERAMLKLFDIEAWLDSKIQSKPFAEIVQKNVKN